MFSNLESLGRCPLYRLEIIPSSPAELGALIQSDTEKWSRVIKAAKVPLIN